MKFLKLNSNLTFETIDVDSYSSTYEALHEGVEGYSCLATGYFDLPDGIDAWVNDEGLLDERFDPVMVYRFEDQVGELMGNVVFTRTNATGETLGLSDEDVETIKKRITKMTRLVVPNRKNTGLKTALYSRIA